jgi:primosomal protein N' (replication factor Y)
VEASDGSRPGYAAALLLDGDRLVARPDLRAGEEAVRRWLNAAAEVRSAAQGGTVVVVAESTLETVQALVRWDPAGFATRELADRAALHLPPAARVAVLTGAPLAVADLLERSELPTGAEVLGPTVIEASTGHGPPVPEDERDVRVLIRVPLARGADLAAALHAASGVRSARKERDHVTVRIDPVVLG